MEPSELTEIHSGGAASHKSEKNNAHFHVDVFETDVSMILNKCFETGVSILID